MICLNTEVLPERSGTLDSSTIVQPTMEGMFVSVYKLTSMSFNEKCTIATKTPAELSGINHVAVVITSLIINTLLIAALVLVITVLVIIARRKSGRVVYACIFIQMY